MTVRAGGSLEPTKKILRLVRKIPRFVPSGKPPINGEAFELSSADRDKAARDEPAAPCSSTPEPGGRCSIPPRTVSNASIDSLPFTCNRTATWVAKGSFCAVLPTTCLSGDFQQLGFSLDFLLGEGAVIDDGVFRKGGRVRANLKFLRIPINPSICSEGIRPPYRSEATWASQTNMLDGLLQIQCFREVLSH